MGASVSRLGLGKGRVLLALAQELARRGVAPETLVAKLPWAKNFLWRSADGLHDARAFASVVAGEGLDRFFTAGADLIYFQGRTYAFSTEWSASRFNRARADLAGLSTVHGLAVRETGAAISRGADPGVH